LLLPQKKLGEDRSTLKTETRNAEERRENEMEELHLSVEAQDAHVEQLKKEIASADETHRQEMEEKRKVYAEAIAATHSHNKAEKDEILADLKIEYSREEAIKMNEVRELGEQIREKEKELTRLGVAFDKTDISAGGMGTGQAQFVEANAQKKAASAVGKKKGKDGKVCAQS
jgi:hypothetical protein